MSSIQKYELPIPDIFRVSAGILALIILTLSYLSDPHTQTGIIAYICKSYFAFSMALGAILLILGTYTRLASGLMIIGLWVGAYVMLLGNSMLIPTSFTVVLLGVILKGPGKFTIDRLMKSDDF